MNVLLICSAAITSQMFVDRFNEYSANNALEVKMTANDLFTGIRSCNSYKCVLLSPQLEFLYDTFSKKAALSKTAVINIPKDIYGSFDCERLYRLITSSMIVEKETPITFSFVFREGSKNSDLFVKCYETYKNNHRKQRNLRVQLVPASLIFSPDFKSDFLIFDFSYYDAKKPMVGYFPNTMTPFTILHIYFYYMYSAQELSDYIQRQYDEAIDSYVTNINLMNKNDSGENA